ncbi:MAG TPA: hypothetical protein VFM14_12505, partial [Gemmatimonadales bacterium]|nr:hypothetical protein [Gemmatimonadales bacterium]
LGQLKGPVAHEALRLRMVALHGREDPLLGMPRFLRLLRQANDAEIADVRQVSDTEFEIAPHHLDATPAARASVPSAEPAPEIATADSAQLDPDADGRNGQRFGVRFRRGSRGGVRMADVPLIGVVHVDAPEPELELVPMAGDEPPVGTNEPRAAGRARPPRKRASRPRAKAKAAAPAAPEALPEATAAAPGDDPEPAAPRRRPRPRPRRKAE